MQNSLLNMHFPVQKFPHLIPNNIPTISSLTEANLKTRKGISYARAVSPQSSPWLQQTELPPKLTDQIDDIKATDLDQFLKIESLIHKYYTKCTNNLEIVQATILIVKELDNEQP